MGYMGQIGASVSESCEPVKITEVHREMDNLNNAIETLHKELTRLGERLLPVINIKPDNAKEACSPPMPKMCDIAKLLNGYCERINILSNVVRSVVKDLEI